MRRTVLAAVAAAVVLAAAGCSGDDDATDTTPPVTTEPADPTTPASTDPPTTDAPTTAPETTTTTTSTTEPAPPTTIDVEALKAEIAADYLRSWELRNALAENPTLDGLDEKLAQFSAPGSEDYDNARTFITGLVERGERVVPGTPDLFRIDVESVELTGSPPYNEAELTICFVGNRTRVDSEGVPIPDSGVLIASRSQDTVVRTPGGWLPNTGFVDLWQGLDVTECPPA